MMRIDPDVLEVIGSATAKGPALYLPGQLDIKLYQRVNLALGAVGGKWSRSKQAHLFPVDAADAVALLLNTGEVTTDDERGWYPTPAPIVDRLLELADLTPGYEVLEPSAGRGAIAGPAAARSSTASNSTRAAPTTSAPAATPAVSPQPTSWRCR
ncbi:hypothetical protein ACFRR6_06670 [Streptomyces sp. NPDC056891]|uniref:hypothetical protein n=1 Tax=Streptomyces sp. NPDC056891 TaxID=3345961 RepID=UPI0036B3695C